MENKKIRIGITHGDTNGVGYELILKTFSDYSMFDICTPVVYGSAKVAAYHKKLLNAPANFHIIQDVSAAENGKLNLVNCFDDEIKVEVGVPSKEAGKAAFYALEKAVADLKGGKIDVLVTSPINKATIQSDKFHFQGHTEYLEDRLASEGDSLMILCNDLMKVALVTTHLPLKDVANAITRPLVEKKIQQLYSSLRRDFLLPAPRIAVLSLNPHSGDNGLLGTEEKEIINPAIESQRENGIPCFGPYPADGFFGAGLYSDFDGILAMYHDQGLAPFKALSMDNGVNFTAGLPFVRTSPDHGTAYDIAGKGVANENSFRCAIYSSIDIYRNRMADDEASKNPLRKQYHDKRDDSDRLKKMQQEKES